MTELQTRKPTGRPPFPLILLEGPSKTGKTYAAAELTASERVGRAFWLDLGEGSADEYGAIEGADFEIVVHNGSWPSIFAAVEQVHAVAARAAAAGEPPVMLVFDSMTTEWEMIKDWVNRRARQTKAAQKILHDDPDADIKAGNLWNDGADRHGQLMRLLKTFPGIAVVTAIGTETVALDKDGRPIPGERDYKIEAHKTLTRDVSAWVRYSHDTGPRVVGVRSPHAGYRPGIDRLEMRPEFTLEWLVFDLLGCGSDTTSRDLVAPLSLVDLEGFALAADSAEWVNETWAMAKDAAMLDVALPGGRTARELLTEAASRIKAASGQPAARGGAQ
ncbi:AAA family ATPase [Prescottella equi]|uniref:AAA family ATPase n=1 Tax=Rhodococcus hoagii TaxID=43767 RepID=UPI0011652B09|nr:AAA family ATPase [Prescottella equi]QDP12559.1 AAA family ATPase [Prescottella equi]